MCFFQIIKSPPIPSFPQGYYNNPQCRYVQPNTNEIKYTIEVQLNSCGTEFIDEFNQGRPAYLENVLVFQNEPGIQEVRHRPRWWRVKMCLFYNKLLKFLYPCSQMQVKDQVELMNFFRQVENWISYLPS